MTPNLFENLELLTGKPATPASIITASRARLKGFIEVKPLERVNTAEKLLGANNLAEMQAKNSGLAVGIARTEENGMTYKVTINGRNQSFLFYLNKAGQVFEKEEIAGTRDTVSGKILGTIGESPAKKESGLVPAGPTTTGFLDDALREFV